MRQGPNSRRSRGRGGNNPGRRSNLPNRNQTFDSNGPDVRIRGNAHQVHEKYLALARDASASGDRIMAENYLQHAEHYHRIIVATNEAYAQVQQQQDQAQRDHGERDDGQMNGREPNGRDRDHRRETAGRDPSGQRPPQRGPRDDGRRDAPGFAGDLFEDPRGSDDQEFRPRDEPTERPRRGNGRDAERGPATGEGGRGGDDDRQGLERVIGAPVTVPPAAPSAEAAAEPPKPRRRPGRPRKNPAPGPTDGGEPVAE